MRPRLHSPALTNFMCSYYIVGIYTNQEPLFVFFSLAKLEHLINKIMTLHGTIDCMKYVPWLIIILCLTPID